MELYTLLATAEGANHRPSPPARHVEDACALVRADADRPFCRGVFGSPFLLVDDERFFGVDKLELIDTWLANGVVRRG